MIKTHRVYYFVLLLVFTGLFHKCTVVYGKQFIMQQSDTDVFDCSQLSEIESAAFLTTIFSLQRENKFFGILCQEIALRNRIIKIVMKPQRNKASFIPSQFCISFINSNALNDGNAILEETFHAFQFLFYKGKYFTGNENKEVHGAVNIEFEAKFFRAAACIQSGGSMAETPSQLGLTDFVLSLLDENGSFSESFLTQKHAAQYFALVQHFHAHWSKRNRTEQVDNLYDDPVDENLLPDAALYILSKN